MLIRFRILSALYILKKTMPFLVILVLSFGLVLKHLFFDLKHIHSVMTYGQRQETLEKIYEAHAEWLGQYTIACKEGCNACCIRSVNVSRLEGEFIIAFLTKANRWSAAGFSLENTCSSSGPKHTTNQFAALCLTGNMEEIEEAAKWDFTPCYFLEVNGSCSIYPVRPLMCRGFVSDCICQNTGYAQMRPEIISVNTFIMQLIEHLDQGSIWGNMNAILQELSEPGSLVAADYGKKQEQAIKLLKAKQIPGFLVPPEDQAAVGKYCNILKSKGINIKELLAAGSV